MFDSIKKKAQEAGVRDLGKAGRIFRGEWICNCCRSMLRMGKTLESDLLVWWCPRCCVIVARVKIETIKVERTDK